MIGAPAEFIGGGVHIDASDERPAGSAARRSSGVRAYVESWATNDVEGRLALFADDVVIEDPATVRQATGKAELTEFFRAGIPANWSMTFHFERVAVVGDEAILTYRIALHAGDSSPAELLVNSHVVFDANGLIAQYRTFFDTESITDHPATEAKAPG